MNDKNNIHILSRAVIIDNSHILLCKTLDLPISFYFLPGGHVEHGESVADALLREVMEETGEHSSIKRFLGCLEHSFEPGHNSICHNHEYNFIFEVELDSLKESKAIPQLEDHIELAWIPRSKISEIDLRPAPLKTLLPQWLNATPNNSFQSVMV